MRFKRPKFRLGVYQANPRFLAPDTPLSPGIIAPQRPATPELRVLELTTVSCIELASEEQALKIPSGRWLAVSSPSAAGETKTST